MLGRDKRAENKETCKPSKALLKNSEVWDAIGRYKIGIFIWVFKFGFEFWIGHVWYGTNLYCCNFGKRLVNGIAWKKKIVKLSNIKLVMISMPLWMKSRRQGRHKKKSEWPQDSFSKWALVSWLVWWCPTPFFSKLLEAYYLIYKVASPLKPLERKIIKTTITTSKIKM